MKLYVQCTSLGLSNAKPIPTEFQLPLLPRWGWFMIINAVAPMLPIVSLQPATDGTASTIRDHDVRNVAAEPSLPGRLPRPHTNMALYGPSVQGLASMQPH